MRKTALLSWSLSCFVVRLHMISRDAAFEVSSRCGVESGGWEVLPRAWPSHTDGRLALRLSAVIQTYKARPPIPCYPHFVAFVISILFDLLWQDEERLPTETGPRVHAPVPT